VKTFFKLIAFVLILFVVGCGSENANRVSDGTNVRSILLTSDKVSVNADGSDVAQLTIRVLDVNNASVPGAEVSIRATSGGLSASKVTTDETGRALVSFDSGGVQRNVIATITASIGRISDSADIRIAGASATLTSSASSVGLNGSSSVTILAEVRNSNGAPVVNEPVTLTAQLGNINGFTSVTYNTDSRGQVQVVYTGGAVAGVDTVVLTGPDETSLPLTITGGKFVLTDSRAGIFNFSVTNSLFIQWIDETGTPVEGGNVQFTCGKCVFSTTGNNFINLMTDAEGRISTYLRAVSTGTDTVTAAAKNSIGETLSTELDMTILATNPSRVILNINPTVVARAQGDNQSSATVSATVLDSQNRAVENADVAFSIVSGPGGASLVSPVVAATNSAGVATTTFFAGGIPSAQNGVVILAKLISAPAISDSKTLTIAGQAAFISIGGGNVINGFNVPTQVGTSALYALPFNVLVTDSNGNPLADQQISLGIYPTQFRIGGFTDPMVFDTFFVLGTYANEDTNRNGILDPGEDASSGAFANGRLDPGNVATLPASIMTDENGFAGFSVIYAKSFANWVDVELSATTNVSGTEYKSVINTILSGELGDSPYLNSPFGFGDPVPPEVVFTSPVNGQINVPRGANILIAFDRPMDKDSVNLANLSTICGGSGYNFASIVSDDPGTRFTLRQGTGGSFPADVNCTITVSTGIRDRLFGQNLASPYSFTFRVARDVSAFPSTLYSGTGNSLEDTFTVPTSAVPQRVTFRTEHFGSGNIIVNLINLSDIANPILITSESGEGVWTVEKVLDSGAYYLDIQAEAGANWRVFVSPRD